MHRARPAPLALDPAGRGELAAEIEEALRRHVIDVWFPRGLDTETGGFVEDFDRRWRTRGRDRRMLEFQARQTRAAARLAIAFPADGRFTEAALHGFRYLRDVMWDREAGGWHWLTDREGRPQADGLKHAHSTSYALQACALTAVATGERAALDHAREGFAWFDARGHDDEFLGYHGWLTREGAPVLGPADAPPGALDPLEHTPGLKDVNVHGDWLEALLDYVGAGGGETAAARLSEIAGLLTERITNAAGELHFALHRDWSPQPGLERYGFHFQNAHRLLRLGDGASARRSRALVVHACRAGASRRGGYVYARGGGPPRSIFGKAMEVPHRSWWVQFEALRALAHHALSADPAAETFGRLFLRQWRFIRARMFDQSWGGVYEFAPGDLPPWRRPTTRWRNARSLAKGHAWKDASHETDSLIDVIRLLRGIPEGPLAATPGAL